MWTRCVATLITDADVRCHGDLPEVRVGVWTFPVNGSTFKGLARGTTLINKEIRKIGAKESTSKANVCGRCVAASSCSQSLPAEISTGPAANRDGERDNITAGAEEQR